jgi:hypothetical protein
VHEPLPTPEERPFQDAAPLALHASESSTSSGTGAVCIIPAASSGVHRGPVVDATGPFSVTVASAGSVTAVQAAVAAHEPLLTPKKRPIQDTVWLASHAPESSKSSGAGAVCTVPASSITVHKASAVDMNHSVVKGAPAVIPVPTAHAAAAKSGTASITAPLAPGAEISEPKPRAGAVPVAVSGASNVCRGRLDDFMDDMLSPEEMSQVSATQSAVATVAPNRETQTDDEASTQPASLKDASAGPAVVLLGYNDPEHLLEAPLLEQPLWEAGGGLLEDSGPMDDGSGVGTCDDCSGDGSGSELSDSDLLAACHSNQVANSQQTTAKRPSLQTSPSLLGRRRSVLSVHPSVLRQQRDSCVAWAGSSPSGAGAGGTEADAMLEDSDACWDAMPLDDPECV